MNELERARDDINLGLSLTRKQFSCLLSHHNQRVHLFVLASDPELIRMNKQWKQPDLGLFGKLAESRRQADGPWKNIFLFDGDL